MSVFEYKKEKRKIMWLYFNLKNLWKVELNWKEKVKIWQVGNDTRKNTFVK